MMMACGLCGHDSGSSATFRSTVLGDRCRKVDFLLKLTFFILGVTLPIFGFSLETPKAAGRSPPRALQAPPQPADDGFTSRLLVPHQLRAPRNSRAAHLARFLTSTRTPPYCTAIHHAIHQCHKTALKCVSLQLRASCAARAADGGPKVLR